MVKGVIEQLKDEEVGDREKEQVKWKKENQGEML